ncbi:MAG: ankyrin repeat domain-containing protein [bacterium]
MKKILGIFFVIFAFCSIGLVKSFMNFEEFEKDRPVFTDKATPVDFDLLMGAFEGKNDMIMKAIFDGANINFQDKNGKTALIWATIQNHSQIVNYIIEKLKGVDIYIQDKSGKTAYDYAPNIDLKLSINPKQTFFSAAAQGNFEAVKKALSKGVKIDARDSNGKTALIWAVSAGDQKIVEYLIDNGANVYIKDKEGRNALGYTNDLSMKISLMPIPDFLFSAAAQGNFEAVKKALSKGVKIDAQDSNGKTALIWAVSADDQKIIEYLLKQGADPSHNDIFNKTAFHFAKSEKVKDLLRRYLK